MAGSGHIDDPDKTSTFTTNITIANENAIADMGKSYSIINDSGTVTFRVTAKRSIIERLTNSDFKATADMENIELHGRWNCHCTDRYQCSTL